MHKAQGAVSSHFCLLSPTMYSPGRRTAAGRKQMLWRYGRKHILAMTYESAAYGSCTLPRMIRRVFTRQSELQCPPSLVFFATLAAGWTAGYGQLVQYWRSQQAFVDVIAASTRHVDARNTTVNQTDVRHSQLCSGRQELKVTGSSYT